MRLGGIDIGTLTCRLLVAEVNFPDGFRELLSDRRILRLGEGVDRHKRLSESAMDRVVAVLKEWKIQVASQRLKAMAVVATSAVRESKNREELLTRIREETGWNVEVLSGEEEAQRTLLGIRYGLLHGVNNFVGLDIGGGSTECILAGEGKAPKVISLDLGVVRLLERALPHDPPVSQDLVKAEACIDEQFQLIRRAFGDMPMVRLVGTAGTITTLAAMAQRLDRYDRAHVHNFELSFSMVKDLETDLLARTALDRLGMPGLEKGREHVIIAGAMILRRFMETFEFPSCLVSDFGLREGVLVDKASKLAGKKISR